MTMEGVIMPDALVDVMLLVGIDDNTDLATASSTQADIELDPGFFLRQYEAHVITAISGTDMVNFFPFPHRVDSYPPCNLRDSGEHTEGKHEQLTYHRDRMMSAQSYMLHNISPLKSQRSTSVNPKLFSRHMSSKRRATSAKAPAGASLPELPLSEEVIRSISSFCFPDGLRIYAKKPECMTHFFVLTDISGAKSYAACLTFYRSFSIIKDDQGNLYMTAENETSSDDTGDTGRLHCYFPNCCVLISRYPYYSTLKECLSSLIIYIERDPEEMVTFLKDYANVLTHTPVPPAGNVAISFKLYDLPVMMIPSVYPEKPVIDLPLHLTFLCFKAEEFLQILSCILVEERIVFLSSNYALLTIIMESIMALILPFKWRFTYSTILPSQLLTYLESPGTFMYGVHASHKYEVQQVEGLVLVDIDEGTVHVNADTTLENNGEGRVPAIPIVVSTIFKKKWPQLKLQMDLIKTKRPFCYNMEELREWEQRRIREQNNIISHACLEMMVNLFRDVVVKLQVEHKLFNREEFLQEHEDNEDFYRKVFKTDMFKIFLVERVKADYWSDLVMKTGGFGHSKSGHSGLGKRRSSILAAQDAPKDVRLLTLFWLPGFNDVHSYVHNCVERLTKALEVSDEYDEKTSLHYILALFSVANGNKMATLENLIRVAERNARIFPTKLLVDLYSTLNEREITQLKKMSGHRLLLDMIETLELASSGQTEHGLRIRMEPVSIPDRDLDYKEFESIISEKRVSNDYVTIQNLFKVLSKPPGNYVDQMTFKSLISFWEVGQYDCNRVVIENGILAEEEVILKISLLVKTDYGLGRIGLTDKRMFFLQDVSNQYTEVVKLREIKDLQKSEHVSFLSKVATLKIFRKDKDKAFTAHLKEERNWWYMVVREMWAGKVVAEALKDVMMVQHAIQNALLIDAVIASGQEDVPMHHKCVEDAAEELSYYSKLMASGKHVLPPVTRDALQRKVDPNMTERERKTVQALLYTGGDDSLSPRLWCGLSNGKIKVYNAIYWTLEKELDETNPSVACLKAVDSNHVWAGSVGVCIIDARTITCTKTLMDHGDELVVDIVMYNDGRYVFTASLDGTIIKWNVQKLSHTQAKIKLTNIRSLRSLKICQDKLICGTWSSILVCDLQGTVLSKFSVTGDSERQMELDGFTVTSNGQVWAGGRREGSVYIWDINTGTYLTSLSADCKGISSMAEVEGRVWVGTKDGLIKIYSVDSRTLCKVLQAHEDAVRVMSDVRDRYIVSGGGSQDGRVCIWSSADNTTDSGSYILDNDELRTILEAQT